LFEKLRVLTFFSHPDDEVLAAGATLAKLVSKGHDIKVIIPSTGMMSRELATQQDLEQLRSDCLEALNKLGIEPSQVVFGEFQDNQLDKTPLLMLIKFLEERIEGADVLLTHHPSALNIDHQLCYEAAMVATRPKVRKTALLTAQIPGDYSQRWPSWEPNFFVSASRVSMHKKLSALSCYKSEVKPHPHPRSIANVKIAAIHAGSKIGVNFAEPFQIMRMYEGGLW